MTEKKSLFIIQICKCYIWRILELLGISQRIDKNDNNSQKDPNSIYKSRVNFISLVSYSISVSQYHGFFSGTFIIYESIHLI